MGSPKTESIRIGGSRGLIDNLPFIVANKLDTILGVFSLRQWFYVWLSFLISFTYLHKAQLPQTLFSVHIMRALSLKNFSPTSTGLSSSALRRIRTTMSEEQSNNNSEGRPWPELKVPDLLFKDPVRGIHAAIENEWDMLRRSACQTAAGRALWKHVIHDPLAELLAGETYLRSLFEKIKKDRNNNAREISGVILAVRTLWFDSKIEAALSSFHGGAAQVVLLGAGMDTRAYRLGCLSESDVFEVDFSEVLQMKKTILQAATESANEHEEGVIMMTAKSLNRVAADITDSNWFQKLQTSGFIPKKNTVWVLEGILYYLSHSDAMEVLKIIADSCTVTNTVLLADFMNKPSTTMSSSVFHFYSDWPDHLLPSLGFSDVALSQIGDPDAHFGLLHDPLNLFDKLRSLPRSIQTHPDDGTPCCRLYLVQASGSPNQNNT